MVDFKHVQFHIMGKHSPLGALPLPKMGEHVLLLCHRCRRLWARGGSCPHTKRLPHPPPRPPPPPPRPPLPNQHIYKTQQSPHYIYLVVIEKEIRQKREKNYNDN